MAAPGAADKAIVAPEEFARLMAGFGPWEKAPRLAVGVSGGADSMALVLLAHGWARERQGEVVALSLDHGLRAGSAGEAGRVAEWLGRRGIAQHTLAWTGPKPKSGIQAAARAARRQLLGRWCEAGGILHLLMAHHRGDQAETLLIRREDASGPDGLAGMAADLATPWGRLLRPLLTISKARLIATLTHLGQEWIEDPSNLNPAFARVRHRQALAERPGAEVALAREAIGYGQARVERERAVADLLARSVRVLPEGYLWLDPGTLASVPEDMARAALAQILRVVGAPARRPRGKAVARLLDALLIERLGAGRTLGGCRVAPRSGRVLVSREVGTVLDDCPLALGTMLWDRRFALVFGEGATHQGWRLARLGHGAAAGKRHPIPRAAVAALPAVHDLDGVVALPHLSYVRSDLPAGACPSTIRFTPPQGLTEAEFRVASPGSRGI
ncbi:MAG: tRNA lysidine(34) synthetase TilS [Proteobacteria bacterium]|nr:tRNA lysidine(34) synthetase TilS [Pseudomonadota bacterium]MBI3496508.1 tRNA lysidine(34) synthetase TilS [Pseudomonadota bacterium]